MPVNEQVTNSVTQVNTKVLGDTPAMAGGNLLISTSQAALNATGANQHGTITMQAGINSLMATGAAVIGRSAEGIIEKG